MSWGDQSQFKPTTDAYRKGMDRIAANKAKREKDTWEEGGTMELKDEPQELEIVSRSKEMKTVRVQTKDIDGNLSWSDMEINVGGEK